VSPPKVPLAGKAGGERDGRSRKAPARHHRQATHVEACAEVPRDRGSIPRASIKAALRVNPECGFFMHLRHRDRGLQWSRGGCVPGPSSLGVFPTFFPGRTAGSPECCKLQPCRSPTFPSPALLYWGLHPQDGVSTSPTCHVEKKVDGTAPTGKQ